MTREALQGITNNNTIKAYKHDIKRFAAWARSEGYKSAADIKAADARSVVQRFRDEYVLEHTASAETEHRIISCLCKGLGIQRPHSRHDDGWEGRVITTRRTADRITRGRDADANHRGAIEEKDPRYARLIRFQEVVGIRRDELRRLKGRDLVRDESGCLCIRVQRGKGGKSQMQRILPGDEAVVRKIFAGVPADKRVFSAREMKNHINLHRMRAKQAQKAYRYYLETYKTPEQRRELADQLLARHKAAQPQEHGRAHFRAEIAKCLSESTYRVRGANREKAIELGLPTEYDRLSLMAVSVFHLSHWRIGVTVTNYMIQ